MKILLADIVGKREQYDFVELIDSRLHDFRLEGPVKAGLLDRKSVV